jgi:hypothetical protein
MKGIWTSLAIVSLGRRAAGRCWIHEWAKSAVFDYLELWYPDVVGGTVRLLQSIFVAIAILSMVGCAPAPRSGRIWTRDFKSYALPVWTTDGMYLVAGRAGALFLTPPPSDLSRYRAVVLDDIEISTKQRSRELKPSEEERLKGYFTRRLARVFESNGWPIVEAPADDVLRVRLAVRGLELRRFRRSHVGSVISRVSTSQIRIILELRDGGDRDRRLLFGDRCRLPFGTYAASDSVSIRRVEDAFYYFSIDMRRRLKQVRHGEFPPPPRAS